MAAVTSPAAAQAVAGAVAGVGAVPPVPKQERTAAPVSAEPSRGDGRRPRGVPDAPPAATLAQGRPHASDAGQVVDARFTPAPASSVPEASPVPPDRAERSDPPVVADVAPTESSATIPAEAAPAADVFSEPAGTDVRLDTGLTHAPPAPAEQPRDSSAVPPPAPRSALVQAAVERLGPLPANPGETVVRLNPQGLGLIEVVIHEGRDGTLDVALRVQNPLVLEAMRQEREAVAQALSTPPGGSLSMDLFQSGAGQRGGQQQAQSGARGNGGQVAPEASDAPHTAEGPPVHSNSSRDDRVNIVT